MERKEVVEFIQKEAKRLREDEHIDDLFKAECSEELAVVDCKITKAVSDFLDEEDIMLTDDEIAEGDCAAIAMWASVMFVDNESLFANVSNFAHRLAKEAGVYGKNIAAQILDGEELCNILSKGFFSDAYAKRYDKVYAVAS